MVIQQQQWTRVASLEELKKTNCLTVSANGHTLALFVYGDAVYAIDNRCPHMGFPLNKGSVSDGILTCHWHHARFDLASGGTFDLWADDVPAFPVQLDGDDILVDFTLRRDLKKHHRERMRDGLEQNLSLVLAKAVLGMFNQGADPAEPFEIGVEFGTRYRDDGWGRGLTTHGCMINLVPYLDEKDRARALYHGLADIASETEGMAPRFTTGALPEETTADITTLKRWLRRFVEVRDTDAVERTIITAVRQGADDREMADMLFAAATDHRYLDVGHTLDFINKAFESLDVIGWEHAEQTLASIAPILTSAMRMEENNAWRAPIDLIPLLEAAFERLPQALDAGSKTGRTQPDMDELAALVLEDNPKASIQALLVALEDGVAPVDLAGVVTYAAALRIARFHTSNEFGDWDTALHTFTFANAVHMGMRRVESADLVRGIFDAAMSIYLDRFLNIPAARIPQPTEVVDDPAALLDQLETLLNRQQQVNEAARLVALYLHSGGEPEALLAEIGRLLLREDRNFHTVQCIEAAFRQYSLLRGRPQANHVLIAAARYLAAHAPTMRSQGQTYQIAERLSRGENLFEDETA
jgi:nitrite reductase/ring-hydroxylating ferredoxin subunit